MKLQLGTSYFGNRHLKHAKEDLLDIKRHNCTWVLHTFDETDLRFNRGQMKKLTALSHDLGLKVYYSPWAVGGIFGGEAISAFTGRHPEACQVLSTGERVGHACPTHPKFRAFMKTWIEAACEAGGDGILWDEPHLWIAQWELRKERADEYSVGGDYAKALFKKRYGKSLPRTRTSEVEDFRDWIIVDFIKWATDTVKKTRKSVENVACLLPHVGSRWPHPQWEKIAALKSVDVMATDPYWKPFPYSNANKRPMEGYVDLMAQRLVALGKRYNKDVQAWLQIYALRKQDEADIGKAVKMFYEAGVRNIGAWGYEACAAYDTITSERPKQCWDALGREYKKVRSR